MMKKISINKYTLVYLLIFLFFIAQPLSGRGFGGHGFRGGGREIRSGRMRGGMGRSRGLSGRSKGNKSNRGNFSHGGFGHHNGGWGHRGGFGNRSFANNGWIGSGGGWGLFGGWGIGITTGLLMGSALASNNGGVQVINQYDSGSEQTNINGQESTNQYSKDIQAYEKGKAMVIDATTSMKNLFNELSDNYDRLIQDNNEDNDKSIFIPTAIKIQFEPIYKLDILKTTTDTLFGTKTKSHQRIDTVIFRGNQPIDKKVKNIQKQMAYGFDLMYKNGDPANNQQEIDILQDKVIEQLTVLNNVIVAIAKKILKTN